MEENDGNFHKGTVNNVTLVNSIYKIFAWI